MVFFLSLSSSRYGGVRFGDWIGETPLQNPDVVFSATLSSRGFILLGQTLWWSRRQTVGSDVVRSEENLEILGLGSLLMW